MNKYRVLKPNEILKDGDIGIKLTGRDEPNMAGTSKSESILIAGLAGYMVKNVSEYSVFLRPADQKPA